MHISVIFKILGILLMLFSLSNLPPMLISLIYHDGTIKTFSLAFLITFITGLSVWLPVFKTKRELRTRDGFLVVTLFWTVLGIFGSVPFLLTEAIHLSTTDAIFETVSGLTTTGATVISNIESLPRSLLFYRQQLQWLGGMGIVALAVAILPMLGIGGMQLYRAESPGPVKDNKLLPRLTETAKALWYIYLSLTIFCALAYWAGGMSLFDAICHSFSTISIGGFSTHDASIGYFNSPLINFIAVVFMFISGVNFALHFMAWQHRSIKHYLRDPELIFYGSLLAGLCAITVAILMMSGTYSWSDSIIYGIFEVVSISTTTGFAIADFSSWPSFLPYMLFYAAIVGSCAGSTGGGMKVIRILLICKQGLREIQRLIHPNAVFPIKLGRAPVPDRIIESVWGFFSVYVIAFMAMLIALLATGLDIITAFAAVGACINNLGPGLGDVAVHYGDLSNAAKWILCFAMLLGRLEIFTLLVLFTPMFWRR